MYIKVIFNNVLFCVCVYVTTVIDKALTTKKYKMLPNKLIMKFNESNFNETEWVIHQRRSRRRTGYEEVSVGEGGGKEGLGRSQIIMHNHETAKEVKMG